jgi:hypothetical protein
VTATTGTMNPPIPRSLPSRSNFAIFRLIGFIRSGMGRTETAVPATLAVDRGQNTFEMYATALWITIVTACYCTAALASSMPWPLAIVIGVILAPMIVQIPYLAMGFLFMPLWQRISGRHDRNNIRPNSFVTMAPFLAASLWFATRYGWIRTIAIASLVVAIVNAAAAAVMWLLRNRVREMEKQCAA